MATKEIVGNFTMHLYENGFLENLLCSIQFIRKKFDEFLKKNEATASVDINPCMLDELLNQLKFLRPTSRNSTKYLFNIKEILQYRNDLIKCLDRKQLKNPKLSIRDAKDAPPRPLASLPSYNLNYQFRIHQEKVNSFMLSAQGCYCCQLNFSTESEYMGHIDYHSQETDFEYRNLNQMKSLSQHFSITYVLCERAQLLFTIKTIPENLNVIIDKIIIFRSGIVHILASDVLQSHLSSDGYKFYINCDVFAISCEQPVLIVYQTKDDPDNTRNVEEHHFLRLDAYPSANSVLTNCRSRKKEKKPKLPKLPCYAPSSLAKAMHLADLQKIPSMLNGELKSVFDQSTPLSANNICQKFHVLIEMEDYAVGIPYKKLILRDVKIQYTSNDERYSVIVKSPLDPTIFSNILERGDRISINANNGYITKYEPMTQVFGSVTSVVGRRVFFETNFILNTNVTCLVRFEPNRLNVIYQHKALDALAMDFILQNRLFPAEIGDSTSATLKLDYYNSALSENLEQREAIQNIVDNNNKHVPFIIFGPPGTGKTTVVVEAIFQLRKRSDTNKILVMAGSNAACDEIASRLSQIFKKTDPDQEVFVRIYSLSSETRIPSIDRDVLKASNFFIQKDFNIPLEDICKYPIVIATLSSVGRLVHRGIDKEHFTHLFIDECGASTEPESLMGLSGVLSLNGHVILSGDPKQLGPIIESKNAAQYGLEQSLLERLMQRCCYARDPVTKEYNKTIQARLVRNYRSHKDILKLSNELFYDNTLIPLAPPKVANACLGWCGLAKKSFPIVFKSVIGTMRQRKNSSSFFNTEEIECVLHNLMELMYFGMKGRSVQEIDIGIISPYKLQCERIRCELNKRGWFNIEVGSVETFQGQEKTIIIASMVRSNVRSPGFLDNGKRFNVLMTRAKALLILVGNMKTLHRIGHWRNVVDYCIANNAISKYNHSASTHSVVASMKKLSLKCDPNNNKQRRNNNSKKYLPPSHIPKNNNCNDSKNRRKDSTAIKAKAEKATSDLGKAKATLELINIPKGSVIKSIAEKAVADLSNAQSAIESLCTYKADESVVKAITDQARSDLRKAKAAIESINVSETSEDVCSIV